MPGLTPDQLDAFYRDGFLVIPGALSASSCDELRARAREHVAQCDVRKHRSIFTTNEQTRRMNDHYFLESGDKICYFFEERAFTEDQKTLAVPLNVAINKIGHNLHNLDPVFEKVSYDATVQDIVKSLKYVRPMVVQSMYIFKQPSIGGEVKPHQDGSYLFTEPQSVVGFWWALEDCTLENGCLHGVPGSHLTVPVRQRLRRTTKEQQEKNGRMLLENVPEVVEPFDVTKSQPLLTKKGDLVLLHSSFVHYSEANKSPHSRHAYSIHVVESHNVAYPKDNWLQTTKNTPFTPMYNMADFAPMVVAGLIVLQLSLSSLRKTASSWTVPRPNVIINFPILTIAMVNGSVKVYVACTSVLYVKFLAATTIQGAKKFATGGRPPEDTKFSSAKHKQTFGLNKTSSTATYEAAQRWGSIVLNDLESIPLGLIIFGAGIMAGADPVVHYRAMIAFTAARCLHTYAYATAMQPLRSLSHGVSVAATLAGLGNAVSAIL